MHQSRKKGIDKRPSREKVVSAKTTATDVKIGRGGIIIASVVIALILIIVLFSSYQELWAPFRQTVIRVDDTTISMGYLLKRVRMSGGSEPMAMLQSLTHEQVIKLGAPQYGIEVTPEDVDQILMRMAGGESGNITQPEFKEWYRQQLNETKLSDSEYREIVHIQLLTIRLHEYLAARVPTIAEQVHVHGILVETSKSAREVKERLEAGENFADVAKEVSLDEDLKEKGGDLGWLPRGVSDQFEYIAFNLAPGEVSEPLPSETEGYYYLLMVSEKADAREMDEDSLSVLQARALEHWLPQEMQLHQITWHGLNNGFDSETLAWINWQLSKK
ncbi:peptidylprolyl isomerase [Chloroflexota bacterium]